MDLDSTIDLLRSGLADRGDLRYIINNSESDSFVYREAKACLEDMDSELEVEIVDDLKDCIDMFTDIAGE